MHQTDEITVWLDKLSGESSQAMSVIWDAYFEQLVRYARKKLGTLPKRDADEEDIALSAMNSFYKRAHQNGFEQLEDREDLWKILLTITANKVKKRVRHNMAAKRGSGQVRGESVFGNAEDDGAGIANVLGTAPTPELGDQFAIECQEMLETLDDDTLRQIAVLRMEGYTNEEIAKQKKCAVRTVERKLTRIRVIWDEEAQG